MRNNRRKKGKNLWVIPAAVFILLLAYGIRHLIVRPSRTDSRVIEKSPPKVEKPKDIRALLETLETKGSRVRAMSTDSGNIQDYMVYIPEGQPLVLANLEISRLAKEAGYKAVNSLENRKKQRLELEFCSDDSLALNIIVLKKRIQGDSVSILPKIALAFYTWPPDKSDLANRLLQISQVKTLITSKKFSTTAKEIFCAVALEPKGYPANDPGPKTILIDDPAVKITGKLKDAMELSNDPAGLFITYGTRAVEDKRIAGQLTSFCAHNELLLIEPYPTVQSLIKRIANDNGCMNLSPDLVIESKASTSSCGEQLLRGIKMTKVKSLILIPATENSLKALNRVISKDIQVKYQFITVSEMVK